ncbi:hypothetical protein BSKO_03705 [Bryopsis sp. KO-2023]|nr:hypothetical protein BSKO_03705 [Bryopsis sp. KO-2023]
MRALSTSTGALTGSAPREVRHFTQVSKPVRRAANVRRCRAEEEKRFDEGAAQVRRLINRDSSSFNSLLKSEFAEDTEETDVKTSEPPAESGSSDAKATPPSAFSGSTPSNPFGASQSVSGPFASSSSMKPFNEPAGLSPNMAPDPSISEEEPWGLFKNITVTQVVLVCSFTLIISLMFATFSVVFNAGGVHFNE